MTVGRGSGIIGSWSHDPANIRMEPHDDQPPEDTPSPMDGEPYDASAPGNMPPERLARWVKGVLGNRHPDAPSVDIAALRRVVLTLAEHLAAVEKNQQTGKAKR